MAAPIVYRYVCAYCSEAFTTSDKATAPPCCNACGTNPPVRPWPRFGQDWR